MHEKTTRRLHLETSLAQDPNDTFLRYAFALQFLRDGELSEGRARLNALIVDCPDEIAAYQQLGQSYLETRESDQARSVLRAGIQKALALGNAHAAKEMEGLLELLGGN